LALVDFELDPGGAKVWDQESAFRVALREGRHDEAREIAERGVGDPEISDWEVTDMLEAIGLSLAAAGEYDESIATFERAIELGWDVNSPEAEQHRVEALAEATAEANELDEVLKRDVARIVVESHGNPRYGELIGDKPPRVLKGCRKVRFDEPAWKGKPRSGRPIQLAETTFLLR
jgi:tetratricopeptide (TPR) repeat protein